MNFDGTFFTNIMSRNVGVLCMNELGFRVWNNEYYKKFNIPEYHGDFKTDPLFWIITLVYGMHRTNNVNIMQYS